MENIIIITIVSVALILVIKKFYSEWTGKNPGCACSSANSCSLKNSCKNKK